MVYAIININGFAKLLRHKAAEAINPKYTESLDEYISINQVIKLIKENCLGYDQNNNILIDEESFDECVFQAEEWIYSVGLSKLAGQDLIECCWDSDKNKMIFWAKNNTGKKEER